VSDWRVKWTAWKGSAHRKLSGHTEDITSVAIGKVADRDVIVSAGGWTVCTWDPVTGELIGPPLGTAAGAVSAMALGQVGGRDIIACACGQPGYQEIRVWDAATRQLFGALPGQVGHVNAIVLGRAGGRDVIACADRTGNAVRIWDAATGQPVGTPVPVTAGLYSTLALARDGRRDVIAVAVCQPSIYDPGTQGPKGGYATTALLDPGKGSLIGRPRQIDAAGTQSNLAMTYEPGKNLALCAGQATDGTIRIWEARTGKAVGRTPEAPPAHALAFGRIGDRPILASSHYNEATRFWDALTGEQVRYPVTLDDTPQVLTVGRIGDRDVIVCGCRKYLEVVDWDAEDHPFGHTASVLSLAPGAVRDRAVIVSSAAVDDHAVWVWDATTGQPVGPSLPSGLVSVDSIAAGRVGDRDVVVTGELDSRPAGQIRIWDPVSGVPTGDPLPCDVGVGVGVGIAALAVRRVGDRDLIVAATSDGVVTWDAVTREAVSRLPFFKPDQPQALALTLAPSGAGLHALCAVALDSEVIVHEWDAATWQLVSAFGIRVVPRPVLAFAWLMDQLWIVFVDQRDRNIHIRDAFAGSVVGPAYTRPAADIYALAGGRVAGRDVVVAGGRDGTVTILDAASGAPIGAPLAGHEGPVRAVALAHVNGSDYIVSGGNDRRIICWAASPPADPLNI
jgi:WD40 repeat protein